METVRERVISERMEIGVGRKERGEKGTEAAETSDQAFFEHLGDCTAACLTCNLT